MKKLNLGCGRDIKKGFVNVDIQKANDIDKSFDFDKFPYPFEDNTFDYVYTDNVFGHLEDIKKVLKEIYRISKKDAIIEIIVPYYNCKAAFGDVTHKHFFNASSMDNFIINPEKFQINKKEIVKKVYHNEKRKFKMLAKELIPTTLGKLIYPKKLRYNISLLIGEVFSQIIFRLKVIK